MSQWEGKSKGTPLGYRIFILLIKHAGVRSAYFLLRFVSLYYFLFSWRSSRVMLDLYQRRLHQPWWISRVMLYRNYFLLGQTLIDKIALLAGINLKHDFQFDGEHYLKEMVDLGQGGLLMSGHLGSWEAAGHLLHRLDTTVHVVMYDGEAESIKETLQDFNQSRSFHPIYVRDDLSHIYQISSALGRNEFVCIHADRYLPGNKTIAVPFLNELASFPEGPFLLALKLNVPVTWVYAFKEGSTSYHLYSSPIHRFSVANGDTVSSIAGQYAEYLEEKMRQYPEQWFNYFDFWAKPPVL